jgi:hypothetical protein
MPTLTVSERISAAFVGHYQPTSQGFRQAVADMAAHLDHHKPGWAMRVNPETLNIASPRDCALGQVFRSKWVPSWCMSGYARGLMALPFHPAMAHGVFACRWCEPMWVEEIRVRQAIAAAAPAPISRWRRFWRTRAGLGWMFRRPAAVA